MRFMEAATSMEVCPFNAILTTALTQISREENTCLPLLRLLADIV